MTGSIIGITVMTSMLLKRVSLLRLSQHLALVQLVGNLWHFKDDFRYNFRRSSANTEFNSIPTTFSIVTRVVLSGRATDNLLKSSVCAGQ